jgi:hypothetical protein
MYLPAFSERYHDEIIEAVEKAITKVVANPDGPSD